MYCEQCGANNGEGGNFCLQCGAQLSDTTPQKHKKKGLSNFYKLIIIICAVLIVGCVGVFAKDAIVKVVSPKAYVADAFKSTLSQVSKEMTQREENLLGFSLKDAKEYTVTFDGVVDSTPKEMGLTIKAGISRSKKELIGDVCLNCDGESILSPTVYLNDEELGIAIPELAEEYWVAPSKEFGIKWNQSDLRDWLYADEVNDKLDISFSNLFKEDYSIISKEGKKEIDRLTKEIYKGAKISDKQKADITIGDKSKKATKFDLAIDGSSFRTYLIDCMKVIKNDEEFKKQPYIDEYVLEELSEFINDFKDEVSFGDEIELSFYEYKKQIVKLSADLTIEVDGEEADLEFLIEATDKDSLINNVNAQLALTIDDETLELNVESKGNHICSGDVYTDNTYISIDIPYEEKIVLESASEFNFKEEKANSECTLKADEMSITVTLSGKCSHKKGYNLDFDDVSIAVKQYGHTERVSGKIKYSVENKNTLQKNNAYEKIDLLNYSEFDLEDYFEDLSGEFERLEEKLYNIY